MYTWKIVTKLLKFLSIIISFETLDLKNTYLTL